MNKLDEIYVLWKQKQTNKQKTEIFLMPERFFYLSSLEISQDLPFVTCLS